MPPIWQEHPDYEEAVFDRVEQNQFQFLDSFNRATPELAFRVGELANAYGPMGMGPGVIVALAQEGIPPGHPLATHAAQQSTLQLNDQGGILDSIGNAVEGVGGAIMTGVKGFLRTAFTISESLMDELVTRPFRAAVYAGQQTDDSPAATLLANPLFGFGPWVTRLMSDPRYRQAFGEGHNLAGRSVGLVALEQFQQTGNVDLGSGFFAGGSVRETAIDQNKVRFQGNPVSPGRFYAGQLFEPGTGPYQAASGMIDAGVQILADPTNLALAGASKVRAAQKAFKLPGEFRTMDDIKRTFGVVTGRSYDVDVPYFVDRFLNQEKAGINLKNFIAQNDDAETIWELMGRHRNRDIIRRLTAETDPNRVGDILSEALGVTIRERPSGLRQISSRVRTAQVPVLNRSLQDLRILDEIPGRYLNIENPDETLETWLQYLKNANLDPTDRKRLFNQYTNLRAGDSEAAYTMVHEAMSLIGKKIADTTPVYMPGSKNPIRLVYNPKTSLHANAVRIWEDWASEFRAYFIDEVGNDFPVLGAVRTTNIDGEIIKTIEPSAHLVTELIDRSIPLPNFRELRAATSRLQPVLDSGLLKPTLGVLNATMPVWKALMLLRVAWTMRVIGEEQVRLAGAGLDSPFRHPASWLGYVMAEKKGRISQFLDNYTDLAKGATDVTGRLLSLSDQFESSMSARYAGWAGEAPGRALNGDYVRYTRHARPGKGVRVDDDQFLDVWGDELRQLWADPVAQRVAQAQAGGFEWVDATSIPPKDFSDIAKLQRGEPESAMVRIQQFSGGGPFDFAVEHVGDLTNRMSQGLPDAGYFMVKEKVDKTLRELTSGYGFERDMRETLRRNWSTLVERGRYSGTFEEFTKEFNGLSRTYAEAHKALPVRNEAQRLARDAAVALGEFRFNAAIDNLTELSRHLDSPEDWVAFAGSIDESFLPPPRTLTGLDAVKEWFWRSHEGYSIRQRFADSSSPNSAKRALVDDQFATTIPYHRFNNARDASDYYIETVLARINAKTGQEPGLIFAIANQQLDSINLTTPRTRKVQREIRESLRLRLDQHAPLTLKGPRQPVSGLGTRLDRFVDSMFDALMATPTNALSRSPAFRQYYWNRVKELAPRTDPSLTFQLTKAAADANMGDEIILSIKGTTGKSADIVFGDIELLDLTAKQYALEETRKLLYSMDRRGQFFDISRHIFPFGEAWKEVIGTWRRLATERPQNLRRFQQTVQGAMGKEEDGSGFFYTDPQTGEQMFHYPLIGRALTSLINALPGPGLAPGAGIQATGQATSLNLVTSSLLPGLGPFATVPASAILPDTPDLNWLRDTILPFGEDNVTGFGDWVDQNLPAYMSKVITSLFGDDKTSRTYANTRFAVVQGMMNSGLYQPNEIQQAVQDSAAPSRLALLLRGMAQYVLPTGPGLDFTLLNDNGEWLSIQAMAVELRKLYDEHGDYDLATTKFVEKFGLDPLLIGQPRSRTVRKRSFDRAGWEWENANKELVSQYPDAIAYFSPLGDDGDFVYQAYLDSINAGHLVPLTAEQQALLYNNAVGWTLYRSYRDKIDALSIDNDAKNNLRRTLRAGLRSLYPGFDTITETLPKKLPNDRLIEQIQVAAADPTLASTPAGQSINRYLELRNHALSIADGSTIQGKNDERLRQVLLTIGQQFASENPDFMRVWLEVFQNEVNDVDPLITTGPQSLLPEDVTTTPGVVTNATQ